MNILIIDYGNSNIKIAYYNKNEIIKIFVFESREKKENIYQKIKSLEIDKIYMGATCPELANKLLKFIVEQKNISFYIITNNDFKNCFNYEKFNLQEIAPDILSLAYYVKCNYHTGMGLCFGTAYFSTIILNDNFEGVIIAPSVELGLEKLIDSAELIKSIPSNYESYIGTNTIDCLSAGARHMIEGFTLNISKHVLTNYNIKNIIITGGKSHSLLNLKSTDFNFIHVENAIILGYKIIIDELKL